jgi:D-sedoheptulose 7-phosphate isomerase
MSHTAGYLYETMLVASKLNAIEIDECIAVLVKTKQEGGRVFVLGVGGSAANASHLVNDLRKICGIETYAPSDNVAELTARANDDGWDSVFVNWLVTSRLKREDTLFILSVGGGDVEKNISPNLVKAVQYADQMDANIIGIIGRDGGYTRKYSTACVIVPTVNPAQVTPHAEAFQAVVWHLMVSHPDLKSSQTKWESSDEKVN